MRVNSRTRPRGENSSYWTSYSDMMAGLMLVFALVMFFSIFRFLDLQETKTAELNLKEEQLASQQTLLLDQQTLLSEKESALQTSQSTLATQQTQLDAQQLKLSEQEAQLASASALLAEKQTQYDAQNALLTQAQATLAAAQLDIQSKQTLLDSQQRQIDNLIGVRARIIEDLRDELARAKLDAVVDQQTGAIALQSAVLFDVNSFDLKQSGKNLLAEFIPVYVRTLLQPENAEFVGEIIIEGHADTDGDYLTNLDLSQRRALAVVQYCLQDGFGGLSREERDLLRTIMTANGRSWSNPVRNADGTVDKNASRRVEFKFRLKDAEMINEMNRILEGNGQ